MSRGFNTTEKLKHPAQLFLPKGACDKTPFIYCIPQAKVTQQHGSTDPAERRLGLLPSRIERVFDVPSTANRATKNDPS
jgi:hypothetical protein